MPRSMMVYLDSAKKNAISSADEWSIYCAAHLMFQLRESRREIDGDGSCRLIITTEGCSWSRGNERGIVFKVERRVGAWRKQFQVAIDVLNRPMPFSRPWVAIERPELERNVARLVH